MDRKILRRASRGAFRVAVVVPRLSPVGTEVAGVLLGIAVILALTRPFIRSLERPTLATLAGIGALWLGLTVALVALAPFAGARRGPSS